MASDRELKIQQEILKIKKDIDSPSKKYVV